MSRKSKFLCLLLAALLLFLGGCSSTTQLPAEYESDLVDGTYTVSSEYYDPFGYGLVFQMTVIDGIVTEVSYREYDRDGKERLAVGTDVKWEDCDYNLTQILQKTYNSIIQNQSAKVDAVTGATQTGEDLMVLAAQAFINAKNGITNSKTGNFTWTYTATNARDPETGAQETMTVTFKGNTLTDVDVEEIMNTTALYATARVYIQLADIAKSEKSLSDQTYEDDPEIELRFNALLADIRDQRTLFHYSTVSS